MNMTPEEFVQEVSEIWKLPFGSESACREARKRLTDLFKRITVQGKRQPMDSAPRTREVILFATNGIRMISQWYDTKCGWGENKVEGGYYFDDYFEGWMEVPDGDEPSCDGD